MAPDNPILWYQDPKLARRFARMTWVLLVTAFALVMGAAGADSTLRQILVAGMVSAFIGLSVPTLFGLKVSWHARHTQAYRMVAISWLMRLAALCWILWMSQARG